MKEKKKTFRNAIICEQNENKRKRFVLMDRQLSILDDMIDLLEQDFEQLLEEEAMQRNKE